MEVIIYRKEYDVQEEMQHFRDLCFSSGMKYLASDLLKEGLSPKGISDAVRRAMTAGRAGGMDLQQHFCPVYTQVGGMLFKDCKLSRLGYALVLLNADVSLPAAAKWQLRVLDCFLNGK
ncbi:MAG TPA: damage-inducible protein D [Bacteroidetes bacterium]|nr:damage-inducible protein D [Bacteroidota bacterium]